MDDPRFVQDAWYAMIWQCIKHPMACAQGMISFREIPSDQIVQGYGYIHAVLTRDGEIVEYHLDAMPAASSGDAAGNAIYGDQAWWHILGDLIFRDLFEQSKPWYSDPLDIPPPRK